MYTGRMLKLYLFLLICCHLVAVIYTQPFRVVVAGSRSGDRGNKLFIYCQNLKNSSIISQARFFRNGVLFSEDDNCMADYATVYSNGSAMVNVNPSCEGYVQCGTTDILSPSIELCAYPEFLPGINNNQIDMRTIEGKNVTLPCPLRVSSLQNLRLDWFNNFNGQPIALSADDINDNDYSITIRNVNITTSGFYYCRAISTKLTSGLFNILNGPHINLLVQRKHVSPQLLTNLSYSQDTNNNHVFRINIHGTPPLHFLWYLNSQRLNNSTERELDFHHNRHITNISSEVIINDLPNTVSTITVTVFNTDTMTSNTFRVSQTSIVTPYMINNPITRPTTDTTTNDNDTDGNLSIDTELLRLFSTSVALIVLGSICFVLLLIICGLSFTICCLRRNKKCHQCKALVRGISNVTDTTMVTSPVDRSDSLQEDGRSNSPEVDVPSLPAVTDIIEPERCNPVSCILIQVSKMFKDTTLTDQTLPIAIQQILLMALHNNILTTEMKDYAYALEQNISQFNYNMSRRPTNISRQVSNMSHGRGSIGEVSPMMGTRKTHPYYRGNSIMSAENSLAVSPIRTFTAPPLTEYQPTNCTQTRKGNCSSNTPITTCTATQSTSGQKNTIRQTSCEEYIKAQDNPVIMKDDGVGITTKQYPTQ